MGGAGSNSALASGDGDPVRSDLTGEAIRLARILRGLLPQEPEVTGLLGLLLLIEARREARVRNGQLVPLHEQDRSLWTAEQIAEIVGALDIRLSPEAQDRLAAAVDG